MANHAAPKTLAECDAGLAHNETAHAAARGRVPELDAQRRECLLRGDIDGGLRIKRELDHLHEEIASCELRRSVLTEARAAIEREGAFRNLLEQAEQFAATIPDLSERICREYPEAATKIAGLMAETDMHRMRAAQLVHLVEGNPHLSRDDRKKLLEALGPSLRYVVNGPENPAAFFGPWWLPELVVLPNLAPGDDVFWLKLSSYNDFGRNCAFVPVRGVR